MSFVCFPRLAKILMSTATATVEGRSQRRPVRLLLFRLAAVLIGLSPLALLECGLWLGGWGWAEDVDDPFVGFSEVRPLFVRNEAANRYEIPLSRQQFFQPDSFAATKGPTEFRIFCLGGSTVQGRPYSIETSFTAWLELSLKAADPSRDWEVVNCGGVSYASYRLVPIMEEVLSYQPDLFIVYTGHNEFLEDRTYSHIKNTPAWVKGIHGRLSNFRTYGFCRSAASRIAGHDSQPEPIDRATLTAEVDALLDYRGGLQDYHRNDEWRRGVIEHFELNLRRMVAIARKAAVPIVLANPVCNLKDTPPFKTEHRRGLTTQQTDRFERLWEEAKSMDWKRLDDKVAVLKRALAIDDRHADAHFLMAKCYEAMGRAAAAKLEFIRAKDEDVCPLRILEPMHEIVFQVAAQTGTPLVDVRKVFEDLTQDGIPGDKQLIDHVHPRIDGHQRIAQVLLEEMVRRRWVTLRPGWESQRKDLYAEHLRTLPNSYFPQSVERLRGLKRWTQGRALRVRVRIERPNPDSDLGADQSLTNSN